MNTVESITTKPRRERGTQPGIGSASVGFDGEPTASATGQAPNRVFAFIAELRRRKVCRALTMYAVALWLISQVVDLAYEQLGLPDWTLRFVLIMGLSGLPVALLLSWLLDLNPQGVVLDAGRSAAPESPAAPGRRFGMDCILLLAAIAIAAQLAWTSVIRPAPDAAPVYERIAVTPFRVGPGEDALAVSQGLMTELQHVLASRAGFRVVAALEPYSADDCLTLTGSVSTDDGAIRVTAALIHNETMEVVWTDVIRKERSPSLANVSELAGDLVSMLQVQVASREVNHNEG